MEREISLFLHFIGFGLFVTVNVAGFILNRQYKKAPDIQTRAVIVRASRPVGLLSPVASLLMLLTGIANMRNLGYGILDVGWLTAKIIFFAIAVISGIIFGMQAAKRGKLIHAMAAGNSPQNASDLLAGYDRQITLSYLVMPILLLIILSLSIYGRLGGQ